VSRIDGRTSVLLGAAGLFALIARAVATRRARPLDIRARAWAQRHRTHTLDVAAKPVTVLSLPVVVVTGTVTLALWLNREDRRAAAFAVALAPVLAMTAGQGFTSFLPQQNSPDNDGARVVKASFPSGHVTGVAAEALTIGYILSRERLASRRGVSLLVAWPLIIAVSRVYRDRHWASDAVGGLLAGTAVAAMTTGAYEGVRQKEAR
jgi:membrane-associated phospholipid phosphatase